MFSCSVNIIFRCMYCKFEISVLNIFWCFQQIKFLILSEKKIAYSLIGGLLLAR